MVDLGGYVIILADTKDSKIKLYGSPADRSEYDEILEINGQNLDNYSHEHIVQFIHQCIKTRTICLRVKRKTSGKLVCDTPLVDAFVIGSRAKEHLKQITKDCQIIPRDIAQISRILSSGEASVESGSSPSPGPSGVHPSLSSSARCSSIGEHSSLPKTESEIKSGVTKSCSGTPSRKQTSYSQAQTVVASTNTKSGVVTTTVEIVQQHPHPPSRHKSVEREPFCDQQSSDQSNQPKGTQPGHKAQTRHSGKQRSSRCDSAQSRKSAPDQTGEKEGAAKGDKVPLGHQTSDPFYPQSFSRQRSISVDSHQPIAPPGSSLPLTVTRIPSSELVIPSASSVREDLLGFKYDSNQVTDELESSLKPSSSRSGTQEGTQGERKKELVIERDQNTRRESFDDHKLISSGSTFVPDQISSSPSSIIIPGVKFHQKDICVNSQGNITTAEANMELMDMSRTSIVSNATNASSRTAGSNSNNNYSFGNNGNINNNISRSSGNVTKISIEHREMPIDVPASFVGMIKQAPRYPPPQHPHQASRSDASSLNSRKGSFPNRSTETTSATRIPCPPPTTSSSHPFHPHLSQVHPSPLEGEKLRKYADEASKKRNEEQFLRSSLRGSKKLQAIEKQQKMMMMAKTSSADVVDYCNVNPAFEHDESIESTKSVDTIQGQEVNKVLQAAELDTIVSRLSSPCCPLDPQVKELMERSNLSKLVSIYQSVMIQKQNIPSASFASTSSMQVSKIPCASVNEQKSIPSSKALSPSSPSSCDLMQEIITILQEDVFIQNREAAELLEILTRFELEGVCYTYDQIVQSNPAVETIPGSPNVVKATSSSSAVAGTDQEQPFIDPLSCHANQVTSCAAFSDDDSIRVVQIEKSTSEPLGATVRNDPDGSVIVGRIVKGGAADKSGLLHEGDEILEVNGVPMKGMNVNQVCDYLAEMTGTLTFVIAVREVLSATTPSTHGPSPLPNTDPSSSSTIHSSRLHSPSLPIIHLRSLFDYDPDDDLYIPCRELGICFTKGDILHVIDQSDVNWWQAFREGETDQTLAGLIPSTSFQLQREAIKQSLISDSSHRQNISGNNNNNNNISSYYTSRSGSHNKSSKSSTMASSIILFNCGKKSHQKRKKRKQVSPHNLDHSEILTYEEVSLYYPRANIKRPIVLIGPTNIGRHELRQRLMMDTERFAAAVPHTSRPKRDGEYDSVDYHFITRSQFEADIAAGKFVEHGEYEKNYYGTSLAAIEAVVQSGKICVLNLHIHSIPILRQGHAGAKLKPYFVFVSPARSSSPNVDAREMQMIFDEAREIEYRFGHYFDLVLKVNDMHENDRAYDELLKEINSLDREPQWIPTQWLK